MSNAPITPAFAWALPEIDTPKKAAESPKPVSNPLLKRSSPHASHSADLSKSLLNKENHASHEMRFPFSPVDNSTTLRQRRKPIDFLPPKTSLTEGSFFNEPSSHTTSDHTNGELVVFNGDSSSISEDSWELWVLVYGFSSRTQLQEVVRRFDSFGRVVAQRTGRSNWVALRYDSYLEAEKALCQQTSVLDDGSVVGVSRMDAKMSLALDWDSSPSEVTQTRETQSTSNELTDEDIFVTEKAIDTNKSSVCERLLGFIFGWN